MLRRLIILRETSLDQPGSRIALWPGPRPRCLL